METACFTFVQVDSPFAWFCFPESLEQQGMAKKHRSQTKAILAIQYTCIYIYIYLYNLYSKPWFKNRKDNETTQIHYTAAHHCVNMFCPIECSPEGLKGASMFELVDRTIQETWSACLDLHISLKLLPGDL